MSLHTVFYKSLPGFSSTFRTHRCVVAVHVKGPGRQLKRRCFELCFGREHPSVEEMCAYFEFVVRAVRPDIFTQEIFLLAVKVGLVHRAYRSEEWREQDELVKRAWDYMEEFAHVYKTHWIFLEVEDKIWVT